MMANTALCVGIAICFAMVLFVGFGRGICRQCDCWGITGCVSYFVLLRLLVIMGWLAVNCHWWFDFIVFTDGNVGDDWLTMAD